MSLQTLKFALRSLARTPGYTVAFILTLGLGIGANTAIFSVLNGVLLKPLPHRDGERVVYLRHSAKLAGIENALFSVPEIDDYRQQVEAFEGVAEFSVMTFTMLSDEEPERVISGVVTANYFDVVGLQPILGRLMTPEEDLENSAPVMVLTDRYWRRFFGGDPSVVGSTVRMNGRAVTIVGVLEPAPPYPERTDVFVNMVTSPHHMGASMNTDRAHRMTEVFARVAPGYGLEVVEQQIEQVTARVHQEYPESYDVSNGYAVSATPLRRQLASRATPTLAILLGAAAFVLLVACANVANLTLARVTRRRDELALRASLGAGNRALRGQLLIENLLPSLGGGLLGLGLAYVFLDALVAYASRFSVRAGEIELDMLVLAAALVVAVAAATLFAMIPRLPSSELGSGGTRSRSTAGSGGRRTQGLLVSAQVAVSFVLLIGAGLLLRTLVNLESVDPGLETETVLSLGIPGFAAGREDGAQQAEYESLLDGVTSIPGVRSASLSNAVPLRSLSSSGFGGLEFQIEGQELDPSRPKPRAEYRAVSPDYFDTLDVAVLRGRVFDSRDAADSTKVAVITQRMANQYFADRDPVGSRIAWSGDVLRFIGLSGDWRTIVGVVSDVHEHGPDQLPPVAIFQPVSQERSASALVVRTDRDPASVSRSVVDVVRRLEVDQPVQAIATLEEVRSEAIAPQRLNVTLLGVFALLALVISAVGVAGLLSFSVSTRTRELGIRAALGADRQRLLAGVVREGLLLAVFGLAVGALAAVAVTRLLSGFLFGVAPTDPVTFIVVAALLASVAAVASLVPAWKAAQADPSTVLRTE